VEMDSFRAQKNVMIRILQILMGAAQVV